MSGKSSRIFEVQKLVVAVNAEPIHILFRDSATLKQEIGQVVGQKAKSVLFLMG